MAQPGKAARCAGRAEEGACALACGDRNRQFEFASGAVRVRRLNRNDGAGPEPVQLGLAPSFPGRRSDLEPSVGVGERLVEASVAAHGICEQCEMERPQHGGARHPHGFADL